VSIPAGFRRMPILRFSLFTLLGSLTWNSALVGAGYALGDRWEQVGEYVGYLQYVVIAVVLVALGWFAWNRFGPGRQDDDSESADDRPVAHR
jgi:membrane protein DedA with SNARE-associated domain